MTIKGCLWLHYQTTFACAKSGGIAGGRLGLAAGQVYEFLIHHTRPRAAIDLRDLLSGRIFREAHGELDRLGDKFGWTQRSSRSVA